MYFLRTNFWIVIQQNLSRVPLLAKKKAVIISPSSHMCKQQAVTTFIYDQFMIWKVSLRKQRPEMGCVRNQSFLGIRMHSLKKKI